MPLQIYNPFTTRREGTTWVRDPFPGNIIPRSLFDPAVHNFFSHDPFLEPNDPGVPSAIGPTNNLIVTGKGYSFRTRWDVKVDHQFTSNHKMFARYSQTRNNSYGEGTLFAWRTIDPGYDNKNQVVHQFNGVLSDMLILSPTMHNELRAGFNRRALYKVAATANQGWASQLGIPNVDGATFPNFNIGYGLSGLTSFQNVGDDFTFQDNFSWVRGKHTLKLGYELIRTRYNATFPVLPSGTYNFGGTEAPFTPNTGITFASFLLGTVSSATFTQNFSSWLPRWWSHQAYIQDDWKPLSNLTVNLGMRYSYETPFQTKYGQSSQFDPNVKDPTSGLTGAIVHQPGPLARSDWNNFAVRLGLAWSFKPKRVFRSSFGIIHHDIFASTHNIMFDEYQATATTQPPPGDPNHAFPSFQRAAELHVSRPAGWFCALQWNELFHASGKSVGSQHAYALRSELVGWASMGAG